MTRKQAFVRDVTRLVQGVTREGFDRAAILSEAYFDLGLNSGGADELTQADLDTLGTGISTSEFVAGITFLQDLAKFVSNQAVTTGDRSVVLNTFRHVSFPGI